MVRKFCGSVLFVPTCTCCFCWLEDIMVGWWGCSTAGWSGVTPVTPDVEFWSPPGHRHEVYLSFHPKDSWHPMVDAAQMFLRPFTHFDKVSTSCMTDATPIPWFQIWSSAIIITSSLPSSWRETEITSYVCYNLKPLFLPWQHEAMRNLAAFNHLFHSHLPQLIIQILIYRCWTHLSTYWHYLSPNKEGPSSITILKIWIFLLSLGMVLITIRS
jgi:hypothetical protein